MDPDAVNSPEFLASLATKYGDGPLLTETPPEAQAPTPGSQPEASPAPVTQEAAQRGPDGRFLPKSSTDSTAPAAGAPAATPAAAAPSATAAASSGPKRLKVKAGSTEFELDEEEVVRLAGDGLSLRNKQAELEAQGDRYKSFLKFEQFLEANPALAGAITDISHVFQTTGKIPTLVPDGQATGKDGNLNGIAAAEARLRRLEEAQQREEAARSARATYAELERELAGDPGLLAARQRALAAGSDPIMDRLVQARLANPMVPAKALVQHLGSEVRTLAGLLNIGVSAPAAPPATPSVPSPGPTIVPVPVSSASSGGGGLNPNDNDDSFESPNFLAAIGQKVGPR